jgi:hypothetical protein
MAVASAGEFEHFGRPVMRSRRIVFIASVCALLVGCVAAPYPSGYPVPSSFDRSWDAALGAASDAGVQITSADRASGRMTGTKAGAAVTIDLRPQPDGSLQVAFNAPDSKESNPTLNERWLSAYQRRMGR